MLYTVFYAPVVRALSMIADALKKVRLSKSIVVGVIYWVELKIPVTEGKVAKFSKISTLN